jgi:hypothetical protein
MTAIAVTQHHAHVLLVRFDGPSSDEEFKDYLERLDASLERRTKSVTVVDARDAGVSSALQRKMQAEWMQRNAETLAAFSLGTVFVITSTMVRGFLTAIMWMQQPPGGHHIVATIDEAHAWTTQRLKRAGLSADVPPF